ncbi:hypothetical protein [Nocardia anaemiae]|uniref:hypothetical protein n=1 Tax=Nocardia anaemiae TaxID=263910 RepID=UPI0007A3BA19|nr:hypothetical protein [Nocardia anaemiae]
MTDSYDAHALWLKAKLFISHAMDDDVVRDFDEQALWAALALELLAKAALSRHSPLLIASPTEDGGNLLVASGLTQGQARFTSVTATTLISRCSKAFPPFSEKEAGAITGARNNYLHGGAATFTRIPSEAWWPRYWAQAVILVNALDKDVEDLVGAARTDLVEKYLTRNKKNIEHRAQMLVERAKQRFAQSRSGDLPRRIATEWEKPRDISLGLSYHADAKCPACGSTGVVEGENVNDTQIKHEQIGEDDYDVWAELTVGSDYFSCETCKLVIDGWEVIVAAGIDDEFGVTDDAMDHMEPDYGND